MNTTNDTLAAKLAAAAPDLLAALIELDAHMMHEMPVGTYPQGTFEIVREAIAKATGGEQ